MKLSLCTKTLVALAVAVTVVAGNIGRAQDQPMTSANDSALPADIQPGSSLAQVVKLMQAGMDMDTIKNFIINSPDTFNLDADKIIFLRDEGLPTDLIDAMMEHDKNLPATTGPSAQETTATTEVATAPPSEPVTVNYLYNTLTPYGTWIDVSGYGRCWRPTVVIYDPTWRPYCDRGHWVYTDCGWYWNSDYAWGATFHYGRWFLDPRWGWCWWPDTVWSPSWVTWRYTDDYCGWAPLPPFTVYHPGVGFYYRGTVVSAGFSFGLNVNYFSFVPIGRFYDRHPRRYCVDRSHVAPIYGRAHIVNNYTVRNRFVVNDGIPVRRISTFTHHEIRPVNVGEVRNARSHGWRGPDSNEHHNANRNFSNSRSREVNMNRHTGVNRQTAGHNQENQPYQQSVRRVRPQTSVRPENDFNRRQNNQPGNSHQNMNPPANNSAAPGTPFNREQRNNNNRSGDNNRYNRSQFPQNETHQRVIGAPSNREQNHNRPAAGISHSRSQSSFSQTQRQTGTPQQHYNPPPEHRQSPQASAPPATVHREQHVENHQQNAHVEQRRSAPTPAPRQRAQQSSQQRSQNDHQDRDRRNH